MDNFFVPRTAHCLKMRPREKEYNCPVYGFVSPCPCWAIGLILSKWWWWSDCIITASAAGGDPGHGQQRGNIGQTAAMISIHYPPPQQIARYSVLVTSRGHILLFMEEYIMFTGKGQPAYLNNHVHLQKLNSGVAIYWVRKGNWHLKHFVWCQHQCEMSQMDEKRV